MGMSGNILNRFWSRFWQRGLCLCLAISTVFSAGLSVADLDIEITEGIDRKVPIAVFPFEGEVSKKRGVSNTLAANLGRSGLFSVVPVGVVRKLRSGDQVSEEQYAEWLARGIEKAVVGEITEKGGEIDVRFDLLDTVQRKRVLGYSITVDKDQPWHAAHLAGDYIHKELIGDPGIFNTKLAFITSTRIKGKKRRFALHISDADGYNVNQIFSTPFQIMSPTWSPDGKRIAYISYENGQPELFIQNLATAQRISYGKYTGVASSPAWSPDGRYIAYSSPIRGNYDIHVFDLETGKVRRVTKSAAIDTEPVWGRDGMLFFTSDRSGMPQIYRLGKSGAVSLVTRTGNHNAGADVSPDGNALVFLSARERAFSIVVKNLKDGDEIELSSSITDEGPSFAPNGRMVSYLTKHQGQTAIGIYTIDGTHRSILPMNRDDIRAIAWSPLLR